MKTQQMQVWADEFGREYTDRNTFASDAEWNKVFIDRFGTTKDALNAEFLGDLPRDLRILEIGANVGNQLRALHRMGFTKLYGVELQRHAVQRAKEIAPEADIIEASAFDLPFKDGWFDLVFTNNVLIHIAPTDIGGVLDEMYRVTKTYIWGSEYYADTYREVPYRGHTALLWKTDFGKLFTDRFAGLEVAREKMLPYLNEPGIEDKMYLLRKQG